MAIYFWLLLPLVAFLYAAVGHGGASGYMALMLMFGMATEEVRPAALLLNIGVSLLSFLQFYRAGYFRWGLFWPFALASVPAAYLGGLVGLPPYWYKKILGILLLLPTIRLLGLWKIEEKDDFKDDLENDFKDDLENDLEKPINLGLALAMGAIVGGLSGLIGIGGGIILSPLLLLLSWANVKQAAAVSALFIFVNSLAGLAGLAQKGFSITTDMYFMLFLSMSAGVLGGAWGALWLKNKNLSRLLAVVLLLACVKLVAA
jgi:hypothetical protein